VSWGYTPPPGIRDVLGSITAQAQYRNQEASQTQPVLGAEAGASGTARTENNTRQFSPSLTLGWLGGVTTTGRVTVARTDRITSGNLTQSDRRELGATLNFAFLPPRSLISLRNRIVTTLSYSTSALGVCIVRTNTDECSTVSDSRREQVDVRMDTGFSEILRGGMTFSYLVSEQRHTSEKLSQIVFSVYGNLTLRAGRVR
jgi:hypothetical protein